MGSFIEEIKERCFLTKPFQRLGRGLGQGDSLAIGGVTGSLVALVLTFVRQRLSRPFLMICQDMRGAEGIKNDLDTFLDGEGVCAFPSLGDGHGVETGPDGTLWGERVKLLKGLLDRSIPGVVTTAQAASELLPTQESIQDYIIKIQTGVSLSLDGLVYRLTGAGFRREVMVAGKGEISVRGGIVDVFPFDRELPLRIEFFGDRAESLREFNPETQRSLGTIKELSFMLPWPQDQPCPCTLLAFMPEDTVLVWGEGINAPQGERTLQNIFIDPVTSRVEVAFSSRSPGVYPGDITSNLKESSALISQGYRLFILCECQGQVDRLMEILEEQGLVSKGIEVSVGRLQRGFVLDDARIGVLTHGELFGHPPHRRVKYPLWGRPIPHPNLLRKGDFVVHVVYGVGLFEGLAKIEVAGYPQESIRLRYRDGDYLYVNVDKLDQVAKYSGREGFSPPLSRIGGRDWERLKARTKRSLKSMARELLRIYAQRKVRRGFGFSPDTVWQAELEGSFDYEDTVDQGRASQEVKEDMEGEAPMDRLVCGDVGFGKTEVALRAAFKAVNDSKQVSLLVPTTILAQQHYATFSERLQAYPIRIEVLSRFRGRREQLGVLQGLREGKVDIIIGTHRMLSQDVRFRDLGLLIIDEEHRFGVRQKERLKKLKVGVDTLSLTATPIPRTLNLALWGVKDISFINTPPQNRLPIQTTICPFNEELITTAITREIDRGGQVYFVHNRVQSIGPMAGLVEGLLPGVRLAVAHGQMGPKTLERVIWDFVCGRYQVLVTTLIIGSGIDIPNVNTLIVNRADRFGLAQLYQLRGRIGRSDRQAYAYLLCPHPSRLPETARHRLGALREFARLGSGYRLALRDLEIRGAGNALGAEQTGFVNAIGFDLYQKMLEEAVAEVRLEELGEPVPFPKEAVETRIELNTTALLPPEYIETDSLRLEIYQRLAAGKSLKELEALEEETIDRFGSLPPEAKSLFHQFYLRCLGQQLGLTWIRVEDKRLRAELSVSNTADRDALREKIAPWIKQTDEDFKFVQEEGLQVWVNLRGSNSLDRMEEAKKLLQRLL